MSQFYPGWAEDYGQRMAELDRGTVASWPKRTLRWQAPTEAAITERRARGQVKATKVSREQRGRR